MKFLKIFFYILAIPLITYLALFFEYLSFFSLILVLSVFLFRDLKNFNLLWLLILLSILLDVVMHFWLGTFLLSITFVLLLLLVFDRFVGNAFLNIVSVFFVFVIFRIFFLTFIFFQDTNMLPLVDLEFFLESIFFALKNIFVYLILKVFEYFFKSYFRGNVF